VPRCFLEYTVPLDQVRTEDKTELIESKDRGSVAAPKKRKNALRNLCDNQIIFEHDKAIVTDTTTPEILRDVIKSLPRNGVVNVIEGTTCPKPRL
jgi:hypothetical protein